MKIIEQIYYRAFVRTMICLILGLEDLKQTIREINAMKIISSQ